MAIIQTVIALIVTLGILVTIHEYGHFWVARRAGVKVLRFAWGFGKPLVKWVDRHGTEFTICVLPLGGYVKMLDEREGAVDPDQLHLTFNRQSVYKRIAIAFAGPLANFMFAIFGYWLMFLLGSQSVVPVLGDISPQSDIARAGAVPGLEIVSVDGKTTADWSTVNLQLIKRLGDTGTIELSLREPGSGSAVSAYHIGIQQWLTGKPEPDPMSAIGLIPFRPHAPAVLKEISPDGAAARSGLQAGDEIVGIDGQPVANSAEFVSIVQQAAGTALQFTVLRQESEILVRVTPAATESDGRTIGLIGVMLQQPEYPDALIREIKYGLLESFSESVYKTWDMSLVILSAIKKMILGQISAKNLGGPITIANAAGASASYGVESFLSFLAYLSISLGVLNLLPIPMLDGGHLLYYFIEIIRGKPLSEGNQELGQKIGMALIAFIMIFAFYNDLSRI